MIDNALVDQTVSGAPPLSRYQFERCGYFCMDYDTTQEKVRYHAIHQIVLGSTLILNFFQIIFNRTVVLKEDTGKL